MFNCHHVSGCFNLDAAMDVIDGFFFKMLCSLSHCLHHLLPPVQSSVYGLRSGTIIFYCKSTYHLKLYRSLLVVCTDLKACNFSSFLLFCMLSCLSTCLFSMYGSLFVLLLYHIFSVFICCCTYAYVCYEHFNKYSVLNS